MTEAKPKTHWTQKPENKAKLAAMVKRSVKAKKTNRKNGAHKQPKPKPQPKPHENIPEEVFAYSLGYIECWLETFAKSAGVPSETLAARLGQVLHSKSRR